MVRYCNIFKINKLIAKNVLTLSLIFYLLLSSETSYGQNQVVNDSNICLILIKQAEQKRLIPLGLMQALARIESGRPNQSDGSVSPWPWTINVGGKGYYFKSRKETINTITSLISANQDNIDIGCMQINYYFHSKNFDSVADIVDPVQNVAYATTYLLQLFQKHKKWEEVIKYYHSSNFDRQNKYHQNVINSWQKDYLKSQNQNSRATNPNTNQNQQNEINSDKKNEIDELIKLLYKKYNLH